MTTKTFYCFVWLVVCGLFTITQVLAQTVNVENSPRFFTVVAPTSWIQQPATTGSSRIKFAAPSGTPAAEFAVIVKEFPGLRGVPQSTFDRQMAEPLSTTEMASQLSSQYNNVRVFSTGAASVSGYPAQLFNVQYSVGTPAGELWMRGIMVTTATTPGLVWTIACGALGRSIKEAQKGYAYWQLEIMRFPTNIKIRQ
ncbi:MAG: hypothetical protein ISS63_11990 [Desulfobacteraceae bacterium]|nr:hypothetical protein [Desulfobacteraceae bacterium]